MLEGSNEANDSDGEEEDSAGYDATNDVHTRHVGWTLGNRRYDDEDKRYNLRSRNKKRHIG